MAQSHSKLGLSKQVTHITSYNHWPKADQSCCWQRLMTGSILPFNQAASSGPLDIPTRITLELNSSFSALTSDFEGFLFAIFSTDFQMQQPLVPPHYPDRWCFFQCFICATFIEQCRGRAHKGIRAVFWVGQSPDSSAGTWEGHSSFTGHRTVLVTMKPLGKHF